MSQVTGSVTRDKIKLEAPKLDIAQWKVSQSGKSFHIIPQGSVKLGEFKGAGVRASLFVTVDKNDETTKLYEKACKAASSNDATPAEGNDMTTDGGEDETLEL